MRLRDHPKMLYHGKSNWPPQWGGSYCPGAKFPIGEVGVLKDVQYLEASCSTALVIEYEGAIFRGTLFLDDPNFLMPLYQRLSNCIAWPIREIGDLEVDF